MTIQQMQSGSTSAPPRGGLDHLLKGMSTTLLQPDLGALAREIATFATRDPAGAAALLSAVEGRLTPVQAGELRSATTLDGMATGGAPTRFARLGDGLSARIPREYTLEGVVGTIERSVADRASAATSAAREAMLDTTVGVPLRAAEAAFNRTGHPDAATLLREFRTGQGPQRREFGPNDAFTRGFAQPSTTREHVSKALSAWQARSEGLHGKDGRFTNYIGTFVPVGPRSSGVGLPVTLVGTPEAHVIGSFRLNGRVLEDCTIEWTAVNNMSLGSYFGENWTKSAGVTLMANNTRPEPYGTTSQLIVWRTDLDGKMLK